MQSLRDVLVIDRTQRDVLERNEKGTYNAADLNRVLRAVSYLAERIEANGRILPFDWFPACLISANAAPSAGGTVKSGLYYQGEQAAVKAVPADEYEFQGWTENGETVSETLEYCFTAERSRELTAVFKALTKTTRFIPQGQSEALHTADGQELLVKR